MAPELAVYASPGESPQSGARLASMCWSDSHGRAFYPQGSYKRFQVCFLHPILLSQASLGASRVASGGCPPEAPTDPYVLALEHTVPRIMVSLCGRTPSGPLAPPEAGIAPVVG